MTTKEFWIPFMTARAVHKAGEFDEHLATEILRGHILKALFVPFIQVKLLAKAIMKDHPETLTSDRFIHNYRGISYVQYIISINHTVSITDRQEIMIPITRFTVDYENEEEYQNEHR